MSSMNTEHQAQRFSQTRSARRFRRVCSAIPSCAASYAASRERLTFLAASVSIRFIPTRISSSPHYGIWNNMIEPLIEVNYAKREYFGVLAESWEFQGKKWVFKLRKNVRFHDGSPFTANDVIYSVNRIKNDKQSLQKENFRDLTEMQALDDHTIAFTTEVPNAVFLDRLQNRFMVSKAGMRSKCGDQADKNPIGTGPYRFVSWQRDGNLVLTRNDDYWGGKTAIKEIVIKTRQGRLPGGWRACWRAKAM